MNELTEQNTSTSKKIQISIREYSQKTKIESTLRVEIEKSFFINLESGNKNGGTMSHTDNLNYLKISKLNIPDGYLTCIFRPKVTRIMNYFEI